MRKSIVFLLSLLLPGSLACGQTVNPAAEAEIRSFNQAWEAATLKMDDAAMMALWADDGISLLPGAKPIIGKPAIAAFIKNITAGMPGAKMEAFSLECSNILISGDLASEWCTEHQVVSLPGKPKFDGQGKMLVVLHKGPDGRWLLEREMWNQS